MSDRPDGLAIVPADDVAPQPWKNGAGVTRELLRLPLPGGAPDDWLLRISLADIDADGPFSPFPGVTRWIAVIAGAGVRLRWPDGRADRVMTPSAPPLRFDGADAPACALVDGPTRDLNAMLRGDAARVSFAALRFDAPQALGEATAFGVFTLRAARLRGPSPRPLELPPRTLAWCAADKSASPTWWLEAPLAGSGDVAQTVAVDAPAGYAIALEASACIR